MAGEFEEEVNELGKLDLLFGKELKIEEIVYDNGLRMLRLRLREGKRFTTIELDADNAGKWADIIGAWARENPLPQDS
jgi:hypothetical protein